MLQIPRPSCKDIGCDQLEFIKCFQVLLPSLTAFAFEGHFKYAAFIFKVYHHGVLVIDAFQEEHHSTLLENADLNADRRG